MEHNKSRIRELEEKIQQGERLRIQAQTKLEGLESQRKETEEELNALGVDPVNAQAEIEKLEKEIEAELKAIEDLLPSADITNYR